MSFESQPDSVIPIILNLQQKTLMKQRKGFFDR